MTVTPGTWYVRQPLGLRKNPAVAAPGVKTICTTKSVVDAHLISATKEMSFITRLVARLPILDETAGNDVPLFGIDGHYITVGDVRAARRAVEKAEGKAARAKP